MTVKTNPAFIEMLSLIHNRFVPPGDEWPHEFHEWRDKIDTRKSELSHIEIINLIRSEIPLCTHEQSILLLQSFEESKNV